MGGGLGVHALAFVCMSVSKLFFFVFFCICDITKQSLAAWTFVCVCVLVCVGCIGNMFWLRPVLM